MVLRATGLHETESIPTVVTGVLVVAPRLSVERHSLQDHAKQKDLGHRQEAYAMDSGERVRLAVRRIREVRDGLREHPSSHGEHANSAVLDLRLGEEVEAPLVREAERIELDAGRQVRASERGRGLQERHGLARGHGPARGGRVARREARGRPREGRPASGHGRGRYEGEHDGRRD